MLRSSDLECSLYFNDPVDCEMKPLVPTLGSRRVSSGYAASYRSEKF